MQERAPPGADAADDLEHWRERVSRFVLFSTIAFALLVLSLVGLALSGALTAWSTLLGAFLFIGLCLVATVGVLLRRLQASLRKTQALVKELRHEVAAVEAEKSAVLGAAIERDRLGAELERRVSECTQRLAQTNDDLKAFSFTVSHDLRAPLRQLDAYVGMLRDSAGSTLDGDSDRYLEAIRLTARRLTGMVEDLLRFYGVSWSKLSLSEVDLGSLVREAIAECEPETRGRDVVFHVAPLPALTADRALLKHAFTNLLANAVKYTRSRERAEITVGAKPEGTNLVVSVRDNGVGFDPSYAHRLFLVFQRLHSAEEFEGSGIGLAHVKRIAERHGGRAWATGSVGGGATFFLSLPASLRLPDTEAHGATRHDIS